MELEGTNRYRGALLGLAVGDALGAPIEMNEPGTFAPINGMAGGGFFELAPGEWTDDTALALCSAESLLFCAGFDPYDHLARFLQWYRDGYMSTREKSFGVGLVLASALMRFESTGEPFCGPTGEKTAHNGSLMHLAPIPLFYARRPAEAIQVAGRASRLTHGARDAIDACRYFAALLLGALNGYSKADILKPLFDAVAPGVWGHNPLAENIIEVAHGAFVQKPSITRDTFADASIALHAALWAFRTTDTFQDGMLAVVNLGWDADTLGAIYGQLAGAYYGVDSIPIMWKNAIFKRGDIEQYADRIFQNRV